MIMKYGMIVFKETRNIGDDIQSYAAKRFLPKIDYYIEREELTEFIPETDSLVTCILNGWYCHDKTALPPSPFINPLMLSMHLTDELKEKKPRYFTQYFLDYLKGHQPIGLRDDLIKKYLDDSDIQNYFSGCLTLTLERFKGVKKNNSICAVDIDTDLLLKLKKVSGYNVIEKTHTLYEKNEKLTYDERMKNVEDLLKTYQACELVITTRLHCALPCLGLGVPVLLIYDDSVKDIKNRLGNYTDFLNYCTKKEFKNNIKKYLENIPKNPSKHIKYRNELIKRCENFIEESANLKYLENRDLYNRYYVQRNKHNKSIMEAKVNELEDLAEERYDIMKSHEAKIEKLEFIISGLLKESSYAKRQTLILYEKAQKLDKLKQTPYYKLYRLYNKVVYKLKTTVRRIFK